MQGALIGSATAGKDLMENPADAYAAKRKWVDHSHSKEIIVMSLESNAILTVNIPGVNVNAVHDKLNQITTVPTVMSLR